MHLGTWGSADRSRRSGGPRRRRFAAVLLLGLAMPALVTMPCDPAGSSPTGRATLEARFQELRAVAAERGGVRVIVSVAPAEGGDATTPELEAARDRLAQRLQGSDAPVIEPIEGTPYLVMELTPRGVERLAAEPAVQAVDEDRPEEAH